ncbi:MAG TPA: hypothetical protein PL048_16290 [Leptospiraceae bacterium]|nr:hypothetical protein [Leptospiraceae bacterium]HMZ60338.1 hypothetical protein [Leptospiraceae bacterium]HNF14039.1 hypothetical protein [Leptospiraceae bacterium]HNF24439.1 hypothetical protein [Leptospiraceae bacterium]HNI27610.1 hypothetical protein [Leptospiraceae bacterium]
MKKLGKALLVSVLVLSSSLSAKEVPGSGEMMFDIVAIRPLGMVTLVLGSSLWIVGAPFALFTGDAVKSWKQTGRRLVLYPAKFTFQRQIGDFPGYMEELEHVVE